MSRDKRALTAQETVQILKRGHYEANGQTVSIAAKLAYAVENTQHYTPDGFPTLESNNASYNTQFEVCNEGTLTASRRLVLDEKRSKVICLNFASAKNPGGGFLGGSQAQEESLARCSGLYACQMAHFELYEINRNISSCLYSDHMLYSPSVPVFRNDSTDELLDSAYTVSIITSPAVNVGCLEQHHDIGGLAWADETMRIRTEKVLRLCAHHGYKTLVLGAWGCGVFRNDPEKVAAHFAHFLLEGAYKNVFEKVVFAVLDRSEKNVEVFRKAFMAE